MKPQLYLGVLGLSCGLTAAASWPGFLHEFRAPASRFKPKFRYWLPDASADVDVVRHDIREMAAVGAGGFELLPYYQMFPQVSDWSKLGYGTKAFRPFFRAAMETAEEQRLLMDFAVAANQGQGVPAEPGTIGLAVHLAYANITVEPGRVFNGSLPLSSQPADAALSFMHPLEEFGPQKLTAIIAVEILPNETNAGEYKTINRTIDLTSHVDKKSRYLSWEAPESIQGASWRIMAWYERHTNQRSINGGQEPTNYIQNGSWIVDHFSAAGSRLMTRFFDEHIVPDQSDKDLLAKVGKYAWEDSMEMNSVLWWTPGFEERFTTERGYDIRQCLPFLMNQQNAWAQWSIPYHEGFLSFNSSFRDACNHDYRSVLQRGYEEYVRAHVEWSRERGLEYSNQPAYNLPLDMVDASLLVDAPEVESFGFQDSIDAYRHMSGSSHLAGNPVVSSELGATPGVAYTQSLSQLLFSFHRGLAGGISMNVLHGYPYSGPFANTTWPGFANFAFGFTEMWGPRQPTWRSNFPDLMAYMARNQFVIQTGTPKVDLAMYAHDAPWTLFDGYRSDNLQNAGFTYDYLSSSSLKSDLAYVQDGIMAPDGPGYKALIFCNQTSVTLKSALKIQNLAQDGLPMFFVGDAQLRSGGLNKEEADEVARIIEDIIGSNATNIKVVRSAGDLVAALSDAGIHPNVALPTDGSADGWHSFWRRTDDADIVWLYNDGNDKNQTNESVDVTFLGMANTNPFVLDTWTGNATSAIQYVHYQEDMTIPVSLGTNQTTIIAFRREDTKSNSGVPSKISVKAISGPVAGLTRLPNQPEERAFAQLSKGSAAISLSNGKTLKFISSPPPATRLDLWNIEIESWHRTQDEGSTDSAVNIFQYPETRLAPWIDLDRKILANVSGIGRYTARFATPSKHKHSQLGGFLHLGKLEGSARVWFNGAALPPVLLESGNDTVIDLTQQMMKHHGTRPSVNVLDIEIATTLFNRVKAEANMTLSMGLAAGDERANGPLYAALPLTKYGLQNPIWIEWVEVVGII